MEQYWPRTSGDANPAWGELRVQATSVLRGDQREEDPGSPGSGREGMREAV